MLKKISVLGAFLMLFAAQAIAQEPPESNWTDRQLLLLRVPEKIKKEAEFDGWKVTWEAMHDAAWGPSDFVTLEKENQLWIIASVGYVPKMLTFSIPKTEGKDDFFPAFAAYFRDDTLDVFASIMEFEESRLKHIAALATQHLTGALKALGLTTDKELADYIKSQKFGSKKATSL